MRIPVRRVLPPAIALVCFLGSLGLLAAGESLSLQSQLAARRWETEESVSSTQMSAFLTADFSVSQAETVRDAVDEALKAASLVTPENARLWYDAYSMEGEYLSVKGTRTSSCRTRTMAVGGDFFLLHPMQLLSGSAITENDLMQDRVVLDETLAWQLFGSADVTGMTVTIGSLPYTVAGVVENPRNYAERAAYGEEPMMYVSFSLYETLTGEEPGISCYEAVLPNSVRGFGEKVFTESLGMTENVEILQNTGRYSILQNFHTLTHLHTLVIQSKADYPYWENAARVVSFDKALLLLGSLLLLVYPVLYLLWQIRKGYRFLNRKITEAVKRKKRHGSSQPSINMQKGEIQ